MFCDISNFDEIIAYEKNNIVKLLDFIYRQYDTFCFEN